MFKEYLVLEKDRTICNEVDHLNDVLESKIASLNSIIMKTKDDGIVYSEQIIQCIESITDASLEINKNINSMNLLTILEQLLEIYKNSEKEISFCTKIQVFALIIFRKFGIESRFIENNKEFVILDLLNFIKNGLSIEEYSDIIISITNISETSLQYKLTNYIVSLIYEAFIYNPIFALEFQSKINCVYHNKIITEMTSNTIFDLTYDFINGKCNETELILINTLIKKNYHIAINMGIDYYILVLNNFMETQNINMITILTSFTKCNLDIDDLYNANYTEANKFNDLLSDLAVKIPIELYMEILPSIESEDIFINIISILKFNLIRNPIIASNSDVSMFLWEFLIDGIDEHSFKAKKGIIQVLSCLTDPVCFIDDEYIIFGLGIFEVIVWYLEHVSNLFYITDILIHFVFALKQIEERKNECIELLKSCDILNLLNEIIEVDAEYWMQKYLEICLIELRSLIDSE